MEFSSTETEKIIVEEALRKIQEFGFTTLRLRCLLEGLVTAFKIIRPDEITRI